MHNFNTQFSTSTVGNGDVPVPGTGAGTLGALLASVPAPVLLPVPVSKGFCTLPFIIILYFKPFHHRFWFNSNKKQQTFSAKVSLHQNNIAYTEYHYLRYTSAPLVTSYRYVRYVVQCVLNLSIGTGRGTGTGNNWSTGTSLF